MTVTMQQLLAQGLTKSLSRRELFKGSMAAGAGALALSAFGAFVPQRAEAKGASQPLSNDLNILNYALALEYLEAAAYRTVNNANVLTGRARTYFQAFGAHEQAHVDAIIPVIRQLGGTPVSAPNFDFGTVPNNPAAIVELFQTVEAVGASAYLGAAPSISNPDILEAALSIHAVEAEHASALADLVAPGGDLFAPEAFASPLTPDEVLRIVAPFLGGMAMPRTGGGYGAGTGEIDQIVR